MRKTINRLRLAGVRLLKRLLSGVKFRGKGTVLSWLCPRDEVITMDLFGYAMECDLSELIQRSIFLRGYDEPTVEFIRATAKPGDVFVDVGANIGFYSLLASCLVGKNGKVIAIEPNPKTYAKLKRTIERNGIENIIALNVGLASQPGYLNLYTDPSYKNDTATMVSHDAPESTRVEVLPLDLLAENHHLEKIHYLKVDVDGFEPQVFAGAKKLFEEKRVDFMQCEFSDYWLRLNGSSPAQLHATLINAGFDDVEGAPSFVKNGLVDRMFARR